jgi:hypothetical protein
MVDGLIEKNKIKNFIEKLLGFEKLSTTTIVLRIQSYEYNRIQYDIFYLYSFILASSLTIL